MRGIHNYSRGGHNCPTIESQFCSSLLAAASELSFYMTNDEGLTTNEGDKHSSLVTSAGLGQALVVRRFNSMSYILSEL
jgi:hypothetical protein